MTQRLHVARGGYIPWKAPPGLTLREIHVASGRELSLIVSDEARHYFVMTLDDHGIRIEPMIVGHYLENIATDLRLTEPTP